MLTPSELEKIPAEFRKLLTDAEMRIMEDIIRRVKMAGEITRTADWQIYRLSQLGESRKVVDEILKRTLELSQKELNRLYEDVIEKGYAREESLYKASGTGFIKYQDNLPLQQLIDSIKAQTSQELKNITQSTGFAIKKNGKLSFTSTADTYQRVLDNAMTDISTGSLDHNTVIKRAISELTNSGLRTIDYASGRSIRVESAVRMAVMTGITQVTAKVNDMNAEALGTDYFEVSWHGTARPTHQAWQGRVYSRKELETVCGLGVVDGLCGANCRHSYAPFIKGISVRNYTDAQLDKMNAKENTPREYKGKEYISYQATQRQRKLENLMRRQRQEIKLLKQAGVDEGDIIAVKSRYRSTMAQYKDFSDKMGLPQEMQRVYADGIRRKGV